MTVHVSRHMSVHMSVFTHALLHVCTQVLRKIEQSAEKKKALPDLAGYNLDGLDVYELKQL